jgi:hypothetical protein
MLLTTPYDPGDLDPGQTYPRAKIVVQTIRPDQKAIDLTWSFGDVSGSDWIPGAADPGGQESIIEADYDTVVASLPTDGSELIYNGAARVLYQWLIDNGHLAGTIE